MSTENTYLNQVFQLNDLTADWSTEVSKQFTYTEVKFEFLFRTLPG